MKLNLFKNSTNRIDVKFIKLEILKGIINITWFLGLGELNDYFKYNEIKAISSYL